MLKIGVLKIVVFIWHRFEKGLADLGSLPSKLWLNTCMALKSSLRSTVYHIEKLTQRIRFSSQAQSLPVLLGISFPKSGTHLLDQILLGFSKVAPYSRRLHSFYA